MSRRTEKRRVYSSMNQSPGNGRIEALISHGTSTRRNFS
jgi:hypothetical protein